jgi:hypothetical protein
MLVKATANRKGRGMKEKLRLRKVKQTEVKKKNAIGRKRSQATHERIRIADCSHVLRTAEKTEAQVMGKQVLRSGTSVGANYWEAYRGAVNPNLSPNAAIRSANLKRLLTGLNYS